MSKSISKSLFLNCTKTQETVAKAKDAHSKK